VTRVRAVAFDFNGTLSDDEPILCSIYRALFAAHGKPLTEAEYHSALAGRSEEAIIGGWLGVEGDELAALVAERIARYRTATADGSTILPALRDAVRYASERVPVAVVSGAFREEIEPVLEAAGIAGAFATLVTADDVARGKPHPEGYAALVARLDGIAAGEVLVFEDTEAGVEAATRAGCRCVALRGTVAPERLSAAEKLVDAIDVALLERLLA
jgi:HAD superfamily hydrolase (TIGR01509 family)